MKKYSKRIKMVNITEIENWSIELSLLSVGKMKKMEVGKRRRKP